MSVTYKVCLILPSCISVCLKLLCYKFLCSTGYYRRNLQNGNTLGSYHGSLLICTLPFSVLFLAFAF